MPDLYIIAGCNGAGKTTASFTVLPKMLDCKEFVNADNIAAGLSPFNPESVAFEAGRIMLKRIYELMAAQVDFAFETTLSTRSYVGLIKKARNCGYAVNILFFGLSSPEMAKQRVADRVSKGGHDIPADIIERRYFRGIYNLVNLYMPVCDNWMVVDSRKPITELVAYSGCNNKEAFVKNDTWTEIANRSNDIITTKEKLPDLFKKVLEGITQANRKLVEENAALSRSLVIFEDGEVKTVSAKELLAKLVSNANGEDVVELDETERILSNAYLVQKLEQSRKDMQDGKGEKLAVDDFWK